MNAMNDTNAVQKESKPPDKPRGFAVPMVWLLTALAAVFVWRYYMSGTANLIPDECSYWSWSRRLDWSYFDNSGMVAYLIRLSTWGFGESTPFSVRFPFIVASGLTTYLIYRVSFLLFGNRVSALISAALFNLTPLALLGGSAAVHDNALVFFWMVALWAATRFLKSRDGRWFYAMGAAAGLCIQSKYTGVLVALCLMIFLLWSKEHRSWLRTPYPWIGALITLLFAVPILVWNATHNWASLHHIFFIGSGAQSLTKIVLDGLGYHLAQFGLVSPLFYFALVVAVAAALLSNFSVRKPEELLLLSFGLPLVLFGVFAFKGHVEANWAFMGYLSTGILAVQVILSEFHSDPDRRPWKWFGWGYVKWATILAVGPVIVVVIHAWIGILPAGLEKKWAKDDRVIWETRGWRSLGEHVAKLKQEGDVIAADSYQLCALLQFNVPGQPQVRYLAPWNRPTQFDVWEPSFDNLKGRTILFVSPTPLKPSSTERTTVFENFASVETLEPYRVMYHGEAIREIHVYRGHEFDPFSPKRLGPRSLLYRDY
jgi:hypothetical protein